MTLITHTGLRETFDVKTGKFTIKSNYTVEIVLQGTTRTYDQFNDVVRGIRLAEQLAERHTEQRLAERVREALTIATYHA